MSEPATRKKIDFLYQEVLGEVATVTQRIETASDELAALAMQLQENKDKFEQSKSELSSLPKDISKEIEQAIAVHKKDFQEELQQTLHVSLSRTQLQLDELSKSTARYAKVALVSAQKMALMALLIGSLSGAAAAWLVISLFTM